MDEQRAHDGTAWYLPGGGTAVVTEARPDDAPPAHPGWGAPPPQQPGRRGVPAALALVLAGALVGGGGYAFATRSPGSTPTASGGSAPAVTQPTVPNDPSGTGGSSSQGSTSTGDSSPLDVGVVDIVTTLYGSGRAAGTGMVLTSDGEVLTNNHVISGATSISVTYVATGATYDASVVGYDSAHDVAVLQLAGARGLTPVSTSSGDVRTGDAVTAVGNAGGQGGTPQHASGTVTATDQAITATDETGGDAERLTGLIETDAGIVAGDSGGPLYDSSGKVIGMDTAASVSPSGRFFSQGAATGSGQGYAIPISDALQVAQRIESGDDSGTVHVGATSILGVTLSGADQDAGLVVQGVVSGGAAEQAGLVAGDTITAIGGRSVSSVADVRAALLHLEPGTSVRVRVVDSSGQEHTVPVTLTEGPPQ